jgi:hypothetical protein
MCLRGYVGSAVLVVAVSLSTARGKSDLCSKDVYVLW